MLVALFVIIGLSVLILGHEAGHFLVAKFFNMKIDEFGFGFPPRMAAWKKGETEYSINWIPFGGFVKIAGEHDHTALGEELALADPAEQARLFSSQKAWRRALVMVAGVLINFVIGWVIIAGVYMIGVPRELIIGGVQKDSPAEHAGLARSDVLLGFKDSEDFIQYVNAHRGEPITIRVRRGEAIATLSLVPRVTVGEREGAVGVLLRDAGVERQPFPAAIKESFISAILVCKLTVVALYDVVRELVTRHTLVEGVVGPLGIFSYAQESARIGFLYLVNLISVISLSLAVINVLPFPALDGGRLVLLVAEKLKGSPIPRTVEAWINGIGFAFLILLMVLISIRDISQWF